MTFSNDVRLEYQTVVVPAICRTWSALRTDVPHQADHVGVFRRDKDCWRSVGDDKAVRLLTEAKTSMSCVTLGPLLIEFRYTRSTDIGHYSYDMNGRLLDSHAGPTELFLVWSAISLMEAALQFDLDLNEREQAWVLNDKVLGCGSASNSDEVKLHASIIP